MPLVAVDDTGWRGLHIIGGDGDKDAASEVEAVTGIEKKPCLFCKSFEKDATRLQRHIVARGLKPDAQGRFETPIAKDFKGRKSLKLDPRNFGWCRKNCEVTDMLGTCPRFEAVFTREHMMRVVGR